MVQTTQPTSFGKCDLPCNGVKVTTGIRSGRSRLLPVGPAPRVGTQLNYSQQPSTATL